MPVALDSRVWKEARSLYDAGYEVTVLCPGGKGFKKTYELLEGIRIYRHPMPEEGNSPAGYVWEYACALFWQFLYSWWIYLRRGFNVMQGCNPPDDIFIVALPFKLFGVKYIFDHHDVSPELYFSKYQRKGPVYLILLALERLTYYFSNAVIATNESYKELAVNRGRVDPHHVFIVRNGPDLAR